MKNLKLQSYLSLIFILLLTSLTTFAQEVNLIDENDEGVCFDVDPQDDYGDLSDGTDDAFDGYSELHVDGDRFEVDNGTANYMPPNATFGPETYSGLVVTRKVYAYVGPNCNSITRYLECFTNNTAAPITTTISIEGDLGSDSDTQIESVSPCGDFWITSSEEGDDWEDGDNDPPLAFNLHGPQSSLPLASQEFSNGDDDIVFTFTPLTINPGQTVYIMHFITQNQTKADANSIANDFLYPDAAALAGLSESELNNIVNFQLSCREFEYTLSGGGSGCSTGAPPLIMVNITSQVEPGDFPIQVVLTDGVNQINSVLPGPSTTGLIVAPGSGTYAVESITSALGCEASFCEGQATVTVDIVDVSIPPLYDPSN